MLISEILINTLLFLRRDNINTSSIPDFSDKSFDGMLTWFSEMFRQFDNEVYDEGYPSLMKLMDIHWTLNG
jgi:hypothetical protein